MPRDFEKIKGSVGSILPWFEDSFEVLNYKVKDIDKGDGDTFLQFQRLQMKGMC